MACGEDALRRVRRIARGGVVTGAASARRGSSVAPLAGQYRLDARAQLIEIDRLHEITVEPGRARLLAAAGLPVPR
jgi:hypothetical protein